MLCLITYTISNVFCFLKNVLQVEKLILPRDEDEKKVAQKSPPKKTDVNKLSEYKAPLKDKFSSMNDFTEKKMQDVKQSSVDAPVCHYLLCRMLALIYYFV